MLVFRVFCKSFADLAFFLLLFFYAVSSLECITCQSDELSECSTLRFAPLGNITSLPRVTCEVGQVECETRVSTGEIKLSLHPTRLD